MYRMLRWRKKQAGACSPLKRNTASCKLSVGEQRVRDFAQVRYDSVITKEVAEYALDLLEVDRLGLDKGDRAILETIADKFGGGPVGLDTIAAALGEDSGTIEDVYEPYLIQNGLIERTIKRKSNHTFSL